MLPDNLWTVVRSELELSLSPGNFATWIAPISLTSLKKLNNGAWLAEIACPSVFHKNLVGERYLGQIQAAAEKLLKKKCEISLSVKRALKTTEEKTIDEGLFGVDTEKLAHEAYQEAVEKAGLTPGLTLENFAVSSSNEVAHAAAKTVVKNPGQTYPLIFLYGGVGVGKTHLMQAVGHEILKKNPDAALVYCTGEEFTNEIIEAIRNRTTANFRQKYRRARVLLLDDVQFIGGKEAVQEEFFHTFNAVQKEGGQIFLTSDRLPNEIAGLEDRLKSRFEGGLTVDIQPPGFELRTAILLIKAQQKGVRLPMAVAQVIAANVESTRKLEGVLMRLVSEISTRKEPLTEELALALIGKINGEAISLKKNITPKKIIDLVARHYQLKQADLRGARRLKAVVVPRQIVMYLLRKELQLPLKEVGRMLGNRDHSTVLHGQEKITRLLPESEQLRLDITRIRQQLYQNRGKN
jgi:chromosomal replication initiator protein